MLCSRRRRSSQVTSSGERLVDRDLLIGFGFLQVLSVIQCHFWRWLWLPHKD